MADSSVLARQLGTISARTATFGQIQTEAQDLSSTLDNHLRLRECDRRRCLFKRDRLSGCCVLNKRKSHESRWRQFDALTPGSSMLNAEGALHGWIHTHQAVEADTLHIEFVLPYPQHV